MRRRQAGAKVEIGLGVRPGTGERRARSCAPVFGLQPADVGRRAGGTCHAPLLEEPMVSALPSGHVLAQRGGNGDAVLPNLIAHRAPCSAKTGR
jgi:hypothetical protein